MKRSSLWLLCLAVTYAEPVFSLGTALPLDVKIRESSLIARVRVVDIRKRAATVEMRYRSVATLEILESFRGADDGDTVRLQFDNGFACPNVVYEKGEECLIFAVRDVDSTYSTFNNSDGKVPVGSPEFARVVQRVKALKRDREGVPHHHLALRVLASRGRVVSAESSVLQVLVENRGKDPLPVDNRIRTALRWPYGRMLERELRQVGALGVTLLVRPAGPVRQRARRVDLLREADKSSAVVLAPGESCEALLRPRDLLPHWSGRRKMDLWVKAGGQISDGVTVEIDFGTPRPLAERALRTSSGSGAGGDRVLERVFHKVSPLRNLARFARRYPLALVFPVLLSVLLLGSVRTRRGRA